MKKIIFLISVIVIILLGGSFWMYKNNPPPVQLDTQSIVPVVSDEAGVKTITVTGQNFSFLPATITVQKGDRVRIIFKNSGGFHDFKIDEFNVATKQIRDGAEETIEFTADKIGSFEYYCSVGNHRAMGMKGTLIVE